LNQNTSSIKKLPQIQKNNFPCLTDQQYKEKNSYFARKNQQINYLTDRKKLLDIKKVNKKDSLDNNKIAEPLILKQEFLNEQSDLENVDSIFPNAFEIFDLNNVNNLLKINFIKKNIRSKNNKLNKIKKNLKKEHELTFENNESLIIDSIKSNRKEIKDNETIEDIIKNLQNTGTATKHYVLNLNNYRKFDNFKRIQFERDKCHNSHERGQY
jgi:hypothetical protein